MKKNLSWMFGAILSCAAMFTSCNNAIDNPVTPMPEPGPDEAAMFVQNVKNDSRYKIDYIGAQGEGAYYLRLDVGSYEEAMAEFLKLLPEGVAATAYDVDPGKNFDKVTGFKLNAPNNDGEDIITIRKTKDALALTTGYAWVYLPSDIQEALNVTYIIYMASSEDDMVNFVTALTAALPYCTLDPEDPDHLICTAPSREVGSKLMLAFVTPTMTSNAVVNENKQVIMEVKDAKGNSCGHLIGVNKNDLPEGVSGMYLFDDELKAKMAETLPRGFSKMSFIIVEQPTPAPAEETPAEETPATEETSAE